MTGETVNSVSDLATLLQRDLNEGSPGYSTEHGIYNTPLNMNQYKRSSPRDFLINTAAGVNAFATNGGKLDIRTNCLVTRVIFAPCSTRAIGVEFLDGESLYRADPRTWNATPNNGTPG